MTKTEFNEKMKDMPSGSKKYNDFYDKEIKNHLAGFWSPVYNKLFNDGESSCVWLVDGNSVDIDENIADNNSLNHKEFGFSGRLLKN
jgi:hypothetical protein